MCPLECLCRAKVGKLQWPCFPNPQNSGPLANLVVKGSTHWCWQCGCCWYPWPWCQDWWLQWWQPGLGLSAGTFCGCTWISWETWAEASLYLAYGGGILSPGAEKYGQAEKAPWHRELLWCACGGCWPGQLRPLWHTVCVRVGLFITRPGPQPPPIGQALSQFSTWVSQAKSQKTSVRRLRKRNSAEGKITPSLSHSSPLMIVTIFIEHLLCAKYGAEYLTNIISFNPTTILQGDSIIIPFSYTVNSCYWW